jgi:protein-S-isoprenylcysteine O-methyltransferase Ste14
MTWRSASGLVWLAWLGFWVVAARSSASTERRAESAWSRVLHFSLLSVSGLLVYGPRLVPWSECHWTSVAWRAASLALQVAGVLLAVFARMHLGRNWSGAVEVKAHHQLVSSGPYRVVRHPIYSGILMAIAGSAGAAASCEALAAIALGAVAYLRKVRLEERTLEESFGMEYVAYRRRTGALLPPLRRRPREATPPGAG